LLPLKDNFGKIFLPFIASKPRRFFYALLLFVVRKTILVLLRTAAIEYTNSHLFWGCQLRRSDATPVRATPGSAALRPPKNRAAEPCISRSPSAFAALFITSGGGSFQE